MYKQPSDFILGTAAISRGIADGQLGSNNNLSEKRFAVLHFFIINETQNVGRIVSLKIAVVDLLDLIIADKCHGQGTVRQADLPKNG